MRKRTAVSLAAFFLAAALLIMPAFADRNYSFTLTGDQAEDIIIVAEAQLGLTGTQMNYSNDWTFTTPPARTGRTYRYIRTTAPTPSGSGLPCSRTGLISFRMSCRGKRWTSPEGPGSPTPT